MIFENLKVSNGTLTHRFSVTELKKSSLREMLVIFPAVMRQERLLFGAFLADGPDKLAVVEHGNKALVTVDDRQLVNPCPAHL